MGICFSMSKMRIIIQLLLIFGIEAQSYVSGNGARGPCDCEAEDVRLRNLQMKIGFLEQKIASRESEKIVLKKGPEGKEGPPGKRGPQGRPGPDGRDGKRGQKGQRGQTGSVGPKGYRGETGMPGYKGYNGNQGAFGREGPKGITGDDGRRG